MGVVAAIIGATISSTMAPSDSYGYINASGERPVNRMEDGSIMRSTSAEIQEQNRRNARLRAAQEQEAVHGAATAEDDELLANDARAHYRAYRHCTFRGYTRSRLHECVEQVLSGGEYNPLY